jgi:hypothetical protein
MLYYKFSEESGYEVEKHWRFDHQGQMMRFSLRQRHEQSEYMDWQDNIISMGCHFNYVEYKTDRADDEGEWTTLNKVEDSSEGRPIPLSDQTTVPRVTLNKVIEDSSEGRPIPLSDQTTVPRVTLNKVTEDSSEGRPSSFVSDFFCPERDEIWEAKLPTDVINVKIIDRAYLALEDFL